MQQHNLNPGSPEWHAHRAHHWNASDAPAMMGVSPHETRTQLLHRLWTGLQKEHSDFVQERILDPGHEFEALARPLAEKLLGEDLYAVTGTRGSFSASFDGITMDESVVWEHKRLRAELRDCMKPGFTGAELPIYHRVQMQHQCIVSGVARVLFTATEWDANGNLVDERHCWYDSDPTMAAQIAAGWAQLEADLKVYVPVEVVEKPKGAAVKDLPALMVRVEGKVLSSNLEPFREAAVAMIEAVKTDLQTDQDFADAETTVKFLDEGEKRLERVKEDALAQTSSIDELFRTVDHIKALMRTKRLSLDKLVTSRKTTIREEICREHQALLDDHVHAVNARLGHQWIGRFVATFGEAIKGKRTIASVRDACSVMLANSKIALSAKADLLDANRKALVWPEGQDWFFLFSDFATVGDKPAEDFKAVAWQRIQAHKDADAKRIAEQVARERAEQERKAQQEQARIDAEAKRAADEAAAATARAAAAAAQPVAAPAVAAVMVLPVVGTLSSVGAPGSGEFGGGTGIMAPRQAAASVAPAAELASLNMGTICARLGFQITEKFVVEVLGVRARERVRHSPMCSEGDFQRICAALLAHVQKAQQAAR